jgi:hypothetical protein
MVNLVKVMIVFIHLLLLLELKTPEGQLLEQDHQVKHLVKHHCQQQVQKS